MTEPMKTALGLAKSLPCQCSDCGMNETASGEMIEIYVTERVAAERERIKKKVEKFQPDFDKAESYQHGFHDAIQVLIDNL